MITTGTHTNISTSQTDAATEQVMRAAYAIWCHQDVRNVADALATVAEHATDPAVSHWAAGEHPRAVLEVMEADFVKRAETERRATL